MDHTTNHQLSQWENTDRVLMEDFNADNAKIDAALRAEADARAAETQARAAADAALAAQVAKLGNCQVYRTSYSGGGEGFEQLLTFPDRPVLVFLMKQSSVFAICAYGTNLSSTVGQSTDRSFHIYWSENSLRWSEGSMNTKNVVYQVIALCVKD